MKIKITKSHGTNNTFIIIYDNDHHHIIKPQIKKICHKFETDGLLLVSDYQGYDYKMDYFNNDGSWETMCANGARCVALFMWEKRKCKKIINFLAGDGPHKIKILNSQLISLSMKTPLFKTDEIVPNGYKGKFIDSGAKHFVTIVNNMQQEHVKFEGKKIRYNKIFSPDGTNINFMKLLNEHHIKVWTYEKGIEDMVMSCGSGSVAAAFYGHQTQQLSSPLKITVPGGELSLTFNEKWDNVWLTGPAVITNEYEIEINHLI